MKPYNKISYFLFFIIKILSHIKNFIKVNILQKILKIIILLN